MLLNAFLLLKMDFEMKKNETFYFNISFSFLFVKNVLKNENNDY